MPDPIKSAFVKCLPASRGGRIGFFAGLAAAALAWVDPRLAAVPLGGFAALCATAPFIPSSSFFLPVISRGASDRKAVALTFDDGPDPLTTPELLRLLKKYQASATFFVTGDRVCRHPELVREIAAQGHSLGNHSFRHDMLGAFRSARTMTHDIHATQRALKALGIAALAYRPPMGITSPRLRGVMQQEGLFVVNFSCRAWDGGNRRIKNLSRRILSRVRAADILLLHENLPQPSLLPAWSLEMDRTIGGVLEKGLEILPLAELIGRPVMAAAAEPDGRPCPGDDGPAAFTGTDAYAPRSANPDEH